MWVGHSWQWPWYMVATVGWVDIPDNDQGDLNIDCVKIGSHYISGNKGSWHVLASADAHGTLTALGMLMIFEARLVHVRVPDVWFWSLPRQIEEKQAWMTRNGSLDPGSVVLSLLVVVADSAVVSSCMRYVIHHSCRSNYISTATFTHRHRDHCVEV